MKYRTVPLPAGIHYPFSNAEKITEQRRKEITQLLQEYKLDNFNRFGLGRNTGKRVLGVEAVKKYSKLIILGKPGAGKTTFLKSVAIQCIEGEFQAEQVPIFITLKDFAEATNKPGLLEYVIDVWRRASCLPHQFLV